MLQRLCLFLALTVFSVSAFAQKTASQKIRVGIEQDVLPYATGGYYAGLWAGKGHVRLRALMARVNKPNFMLNKEFTNNKVTAYALVGDLFLKENWQGWWLSSGLVQWKSSIQSKEQASTAHFTNLLLNGSMGYNWMLSKKIYISPWAGMHLRISGDRKVLVDGHEFTPPLLNPEASVKLGWIIN